MIRTERGPFPGWRKKPAKYRTVCETNPCGPIYECIPHIGSLNYTCVCSTYTDGLNSCSKDDTFCHPLGMENKQILDSQLSASGIYDSNFQPWNARLNIGPRAWIPNPVANSWLQIDLKKPTMLYGIATQGRQIMPTEVFYTYQLSTFKDGGVWSVYREKGIPKTFTGNEVNRNHDIVRHKLNEPLVVLKVRFLPKSWNGPWPGVRMELYGCN
ncbi:Neuropilin-2 [Exaiptasia diaphana]|nr:Neuropilin-2 [Exaiptasia diaphana]